MAHPFLLVHIDTGHNFPETIEYRDWLVNEMGARLIVGHVEDSIARGTAVEERGINASRNALQTVTLLETVEAHKFDAAMGGARRDEEKARAKKTVSVTVMSSASGIRKNQRRNSGTCSTARNI